MKVGRSQGWLWPPSCQGALWVPSCWAVGPNAKQSCLQLLVLPSAPLVCLSLSGWSWEIVVCAKTAAPILSFFFPHPHPFSPLSAFWLDFHALHQLCIAGRIIQPCSNPSFQHLHIFVYNLRSFFWPARMNSESSVNLTFYLKYGCWSHLFFLTVFSPWENPWVESWRLWIYWQTGQQLTSHVW